MNIDDVRRHALALPGTTEQPHFQRSSLRVAHKNFVSIPPDESSIHVFVPEHWHEIARGLHPQFVEKLFWGQRVAGVRVVLAEAEPDVVMLLVDQARAAKAPKRVLESLR